jgi:hypothetical protein
VPHHLPVRPADARKASTSNIPPSTMRCRRWTRRWPSGCANSSSPRDSPSVDSGWALPEEGSRRVWQLVPGQDGYPTGRWRARGLDSRYRRRPDLCPVVSRRGPAIALCGTNAPAWLVRQLAFRRLAVAEVIAMLEQ